VLVGISTSVVRFGPFEFDPASQELRKSGTPIRLQPHPAKVLALLLSRPGRLVTREELSQEVWGAETFVDFEQGLNFCVRQIRVALGDNADSPRYIETLPRRGYRFIVPPEQTRGASVPTSDSALSQSASPWFRLARPATVVVFVSLVLVLAVLLFGNRAGRFRGGSSGKIMLAVLPFATVGTDPQHEYLAEGLTDEMITQLGGLQHERLGVIARTSAMQYKNTTKRIDQIGRELGVDYIVEGEVIRDGPRVRVNAQMVQVTDQTHLWANHYDFTISDALKLQSEVAASITNEVRLKLNAHGQIRLARRQTSSAEAYEAYLKGRYFQNRRTGGTLSSAIAYFNDAIRKDASYAQAYAGLADSYTLMGLWGSPGDNWLRATAAARKAVELDPDLAEAHASLGYIAMGYEWNWKQAEQEFKRSLELDPNYANAHHWYGYYLMELGRFEEAKPEFERARQLDPLSVWISANVGFGLYFARQYDRAIQHWQQTLEMDPNFALVHGYMAMAYGKKGQYHDAISEAQRALDLSPDSPGSIGNLGHLYGAMGDEQAAHKQLRYLDDLSKRTFVPAFYVAYVYVGLGDQDEAFKWLDKACQERMGWLIDLKSDPSFDGIRQDARYPELLKRLGLFSVAVPYALLPSRIGSSQGSMATRRR